MPSKSFVTPFIRAYSMKTNKWKLMTTILTDLQWIATLWKNATGQEYTSHLLEMGFVTINTITPVTIPLFVDSMEGIAVKTRAKNRNSPIWIVEPMDMHAEIQSPISAIQRSH
jgi:hypothetical protein